MFYLGEHLASHGYVVVGIDHTDSTTGEVDFAASPFSGFPSTLINRARDQQFVLDYFSTAKSDLAKAVDTENALVQPAKVGVDELKQLCLKLKSEISALFITPLI